MSKYLGPKQKKYRALGLKEYIRSKKIAPPGQHGGKRRRHSLLYFQNQEKGKILFLYGMRERQLRNLFVKLKKKKGNIGENALINCELRLDNLIFKSGLLNTIDFAREWVSHGHFLINGKKVKIPSYKVELGQVISLKKEKDKENKLVKSSLEKNTKVPPYVSFDKQKLIITLLRYPLPEELNKNIDTSLVVELYNQRI